MSRVRPLSWVLRGLVALMPLAAVLCTTGAGRTAPTWLVVVVWLVGAGWAVFPESTAGGVAHVAVQLRWGLGLRDGLDVWALPAAAALLLAHVAALLLSYGPPSLQLDGATVRLWVRRAAAVYLGAPLTFGLAVWVRDEPAPAAVWTVGLAAAFAALASASVLLSVYLWPEERSVDRAID